VLLGTVRPIQAARIVKALTILGVERIVFVPTQLGEKSYTQSNFYQQQEYRNAAREGAEQAENPRLPDIIVASSLSKGIALIAERTNESGQPTESSTKIVLHPAHDAPLLGSVVFRTTPIALAVGSERGWTEDELIVLRHEGYDCYSLGDRILKTETATIAAVSIILARLGFL